MTDKVVTGTEEDTVEVDVVVLGGGPAGEHAVWRCHDAGLSTALVEEELVGGECSYWACMPSKTLLRPGQVLAAARNVPGAAQAVSGELDAAAALARRNWMTGDWHDDGQVTWLQSVDAMLVRGHGRLAGERLVEVEHDGRRRQLVARRAVIVATGSDPVIPPVPGLAETRHWDNRGATSAQEIPRRLAVLGGGAVGVELAQAFRRLGSAEVTLVEAAERLLAGQEPFAGEIVAQAFAEEGIEVLVATRATAVAPAEDGAIELTVAASAGSTPAGAAGAGAAWTGTAGAGPAGGAAGAGPAGSAAGAGPAGAGAPGIRRIVVDQLLVATGRRPRTADIGAEVVGCEPGRPLPVDDRLRVTTVPGGWLYAIGDVNGHALLTHMGKYQARIVADTIAGGTARDEADGRAVPGVIFTDPQVASVGLTEAAARRAGREIDVVHVPLDEVAASSIVGERARGAGQIVVERPDGVVIGATFVGPEVGEMLQAATIAVAAGLRVEQLRHAVPAYPTLSEVWIELVQRALQAHRP